MCVKYTYVNELLSTHLFCLLFPPPPYHSEGISGLRNSFHSPTIIKLSMMVPPAAVKGTCLLYVAI